MVSDTRLPLIDLARTAALVAMILFHFGRDLDVLGVWPPGSSFTPAWQWSARLIAGSFVFLAGVNLWLAHGAMFRRGAYLKRLGLLVMAAAGVSLATYVTFPDAWVRFGILHSISLSSVIALAFLRLPWALTVGAGAVVLWVGASVTLGAMAHPAWLWLGLGPVPFAMMDWEPVFPWTGPFLLGLGFARWADGRGWLLRIRGWPTGPIWHRLGWPGRHSLMIYLIHQPILIAGILGYIWVSGQL